MEDPLEDKVMFQKDVNGPIWRGVTTSTTTPWRAGCTTFKNTGGTLRH